MWFRKRKKSSTAPTSDRLTLQALRELREMLWDPSARFSISATLKTVAEFEANLPSEDADPEILAEIAYAYGYLYTKQGELERANDAYLAAIARHAVSPFLPEKVALSARLGVALNYGEMGSWGAAVGAMNDVLPDMARSEYYNEDQIAGANERLAFWLHESGDFKAAAARNLEVIAAGEALFGDDAWQLTTSLTNLAQNYHAMSEPEKAQPVLERVLEIARHHDDPEKTHEMLFQLGVLHFEMDNRERAGAYFEEALTFAKKTGEAWLIEQATENLDGYHQRMKALE